MTELPELRRLVAAARAAEQEIAAVGSLANRTHEELADALAALRLAALERVVEAVRSAEVCNCYVKPILESLAALDAPAKEVK